MEMDDQNYLRNTILPLLHPVNKQKNTDTQGVHCIPHTLVCADLSDEPTLSDGLSFALLIYNYSLSS